MSNRISLLTILGAAVLSHLYGQTDVARLVGTVTDPSNAVVQGAIVTLKNVRTGVTRSAVTNERGDYVVNQLPPAAYTVKAEAEGMSPAEFNEVILQVGQERRLDIGLSPAGVTTEVNVSAGSLVAIDTSSAR